VIQDIGFPLVLIDDVYEPLILVARKLHRNRRSPPTDLLQQAARRESPPQHVAILSKVFIFSSVVLPGDIYVSNEGPHLVERLEPVCQPVAYIKEPVIRQPQRSSTCAPPLNALICGCEQVLAHWKPHWPARPKISAQSCTNRITCRGSPLMQSRIQSFVPLWSG
jgi:hypothetical protein